MHTAQIELPATKISEPFPLLHCCGPKEKYCKSLHKKSLIHVNMEHEHMGSSQRLVSVLSLCHQKILICFPQSYWARTGRFQPKYGLVELIVRLNKDDDI